MDNEKVATACPNAHGPKHGGLRDIFKTTSDACSSLAFKYMKPLVEATARQTCAREQGLSRFMLPDEAQLHSGRRGCSCARAQLWVKSTRARFRV